MSTPTHTLVPSTTLFRCPTTIASVLAVDGLAARFGCLVVQRGADFGVADFDARRGQVARELADDVLVARFLEVRLHDGLGISVGFLGRQPHAPGRPFAEEPVAARGDTEQPVLVARESRLESPFPVVECAHNALTGSTPGSRSVEHP